MTLPDKRLFTTLLASFLLASYVKAQTDCTSSILNPNFDGLSFAGWQQQGMKLQTNSAFTLKDGYAYARLLWSSSYYDYMIVDEVRYDNQTDDGSNSTFVIPILAMDEEIPVIADTTAMGDPVEIDYNLTFYSNTVDDKDAIPQEAAVKVLILALIIIAVGGVLNYVLKKRRKQ